MNSKKLQTKVFLNTNSIDRKFSSTAIVTYFNKDAEDKIFDFESYFDLNSDSFKDAIAHITAYKQLHNYYSLAYNEDVPNMNKYLLKIKFKLTDLLDIKHNMTTVDKVLDGSLQHQMLYDLACMLDNIVENGYEYVAISLYPATITKTACIIRTLSENDESQNILPISMANEYTNIKELDLGGFGNTVSGYNSITFNFYPFMYNNKICIQVVGSGKLSTDTFNVSFATYNSKDNEPEGLIEFSFKSADDKDKLINNKSEFNIFNERIKDFLNAEAVLNDKISNDEKIKFAIKSVKYTNSSTKEEKDLTDSFINDYLNGENKLTLDLLHRVNF